LTKFLNPDATEADLGEKMQAYYDKEKKVWVFPGEDPAELAKPIGPPPITPMATSSVPEQSRPPANDPLAAMMAPPQRKPRGRVTKASPSSMPIILPGTPMGSNPPKFSVFMATPLQKVDNDTKEHENTID
jgi:hypothetical protein